jgi:hypothetical protein
MVIAMLGNIKKDLNLEKVNLLTVVAQLMKEILRRTNIMVMAFIQLLMEASILVNTKTE